MIKMIKDWIVECIVSRLENKRKLQEELNKIAEENPYKVVLLYTGYIAVAGLLAYIIMAIIR